MKEDDSNWPPPDRVGRQELEVILGDQHISFTTTKLGSLMQVSRVLRYWKTLVSHRYHAPGCPAPPDNAVRSGSQGTYSTLTISKPRTHGLKQDRLVQVQQSKDPEGLRAFYYLVQVRPRS